MMQTSSNWTPEFRFPVMIMDMPVDENVERRSLCEESWREACAERWYRSQDAGCDMGEHALRQWVRLHWRGFLRARWIEHMQGIRFWVELHRCEFGLLRRRDLVDARELLDEIVNQLRQGAENLDIVRWARREKTPAEQATIKELLTLININAYRLRCSFCDD
jgi:hypothetical protein